MYSEPDDLDIESDDLGGAGTGKVVDAEASILNSYLDEAGTIDRISDERVKELSQIIKEGNENDREEAINEVLSANLRLVVHFVFKFLDKHRGTVSFERSGLSVNDLIQEGNIALIRAIEKYDPSTGNKLSTYASHWIKRYLANCLDAYSGPLIPKKHLPPQLRGYYIVQEKLKAELRREPTKDEILDYMSTDARFNRENFEKFLNSWQRTEKLYKFSLDEDGNVQYEEKYGDPPESDKTLEEIVRRDTKVQLQALLENTLNQWEQKVINLRFGLGDDPLTLTLQEVADIRGITREAVRQTEASALKKLGRKVWPAGQGNLGD